MTEYNSLTQGGNWKTNGETVLLEALPGETYAVMQWTQDEDNPDGPPYVQTSWLTSEAPMEIGLKETKKLMVLRVAEASSWTGKIFAPCSPPHGCPFPPEPDPVGPWPFPNPFAK